MSAQDSPRETSSLRGRLLLAARASWIVAAVFYAGLCIARASWSPMWHTLSCAETRIRRPFALTWVRSTGAIFGALQGASFTRWLYPDHARLKSPG
jgi:hypothetical protein